jgi:hypothetical protein
LFKVLRPIGVSEKWIFNKQPFQILIQKWSKSYPYAIAYLCELLILPLNNCRIWLRESQYW